MHNVSQARDISHEKLTCKSYWIYIFGFILIFKTRVYKILYPQGFPNQFYSIPIFHIFIYTEISSIQSFLNRKVLFTGQYASSAITFPIHGEFSPCVTEIIHENFKQNYHLLKWLLSISALAGDMTTIQMSQTTRESYSNGCRQINLSFIYTYK